MSTAIEKEKRETFWTKTEKETSKETYGCEIQRNLQKRETYWTKLIQKKKLKRNLWM